MDHEAFAAAFIGNTSPAFCVAMDQPLRHIVAIGHPNLSDRDRAEVVAAIRRIVEPTRVSQRSTQPTLM